MQILKLSILLSVILALSSCTMPIRFWLINNTAAYIAIEIGERPIHIEPGQAKLTRGVATTFSITGENIEWRYNLEREPLEYVNWRGWGPFSKRVVYVQLNSNGSIWVLKEKLTEPTVTFIKQPKGFPLEPNS